MRLHHLAHQAGTGWTTPLPAEDDGPTTLVLAFGAPCYADDWAPFRQLAAAFPQAQLIGCSTAGEIAGAAVHDASISATVVRFDGTRLRRAAATIATVADSRAAGARLAEQLAAPDLRAVFVLSDGLCVNGSALVEGMAQRLSPDIAITGALAGDGSAFASTWLVGREGPQAHQACAIGFYGQRLRVGHGCDGGWHDFGPESLELVRYMVELTSERPLFHIRNTSTLLHLDGVDPRTFTPHDVPFSKADIRRAAD